MAKDLNKTVKHHIFCKMEVFDVLPANPQHLGRKFIVQQPLGLLVPFDRFFDQLFFVDM